MPVIKQPLTKIKLKNVSIVRYKVNNIVFEIACYANKLKDWKEGKEKDLRDVLQADIIFSNVNKGEIAKNQELKNVFNSIDFLTCAKIILEKGELRLSNIERELVRKDIIKNIFILTTEKLVSTSSNFNVTCEQVETACRKHNLYPKNINKLPAKAIATKLAHKLAYKLPEDFAINVIFVKITSRINTEFDDTNIEELKNILLNTITTYNLIISFTEISFYCLLADLSLIQFVSDKTNEKYLFHIDSTPIHLPVIYLKQIVEKAKKDFANDEQLEKLDLDSIDHNISCNADHSKIDNSKINDINERSIASSIDNFDNNKEGIGTEVHQKDNLNNCITCNVYIQNLKAHIKTDYHIYNQKRKYKGLQPIPLHEFENYYLVEAKNYSTLED